MIDSILVATDGSECADAAELCAVALASRLRAGLSGITVVDERVIREPIGFRAALPSFPESELSAYHRARAEAIARRFEERAHGNSAEASCEVAQGNAAERIVEKGLAAGLTIIGRDGQTEARRGALIGSTVDAVLRKSNKPVLVVPAGAQTTGTLVLGFDGSPGSRLAAQLAVTLASAMGESIQVFVDSKDKGRAVTRFEDVRKIVGGLSVPVGETSSTLGRPDVKLVDAARDVRAGMIVMGAFGRNRISDYFIGSNAAAVVRTSPFPVLLVR